MAGHLGLGILGPMKPDAVPPRKGAIFPMNSRRRRVQMKNPLAKEEQNSHEDRMEDRMP
jgi:hypothetical protein